MTGAAKPGIVKAAVALMYLVVALGIVRTAMTVIRHIEVRTPDLYIISKALIYVVSVILIYQISKGRNWARWALMVFLAIAFPLGVLPTFDSIQHNPIHALLGLVQLAAFATAAILLFQKKSSAWFKPTHQPD